MRRWAFRLLFLLSLVPLLLTTLLWLSNRVSYRYFLPDGSHLHVPQTIPENFSTSGEPRNNSRYFIELYFPDGICIARFDPRPSGGPVNSPPRIKDTLFGFPHYGYPVVEGYITEFSVPYWFIFATTSLLPLPLVCFRFAPIMRRRRAHLRFENGLCIHCGYDLRGGSVRCPECGRKVGPPPTDLPAPPNPIIATLWRPLRLILAAPVFVLAVLILLAAIYVELPRGARCILILYALATASAAAWLLRRAPQAASTESAPFATNAKPSIDPIDPGAVPVEKPVPVPSPADKG
jgi:hypothetical protein